MQFSRTCAVLSVLFANFVWTLPAQAQESAAEISRASGPDASRSLVLTASQNGSHVDFIFRCLGGGRTVSVRRYYIDDEKPSNRRYTRGCDARCRADGADQQDLPTIGFRQANASALQAWWVISRYGTVQGGPSYPARSAFIPTLSREDYDNVHRYVDERQSHRNADSDFNSPFDGSGGGYFNRPMNAEDRAAKQRFYRVCIAQPVRHRTARGH